MERSGFAGVRAAGGAPPVSAVVPTRGRPELVVRAVRSVLRQTAGDIEAVVVVDGPDEATERALRAVGDRRVRVVRLARTRGVGAARNAGVGEARGQWVAFLDDDDEWLPGKIDAQLRAARACPDPSPIVACRAIRREAAAEIVLPGRTPRPGEPMCEYLLRRSRLLPGEGILQPSTILTTRELLARVPFRVGLRRHEDLDWLLRACGAAGTRVVFVPGAAPLAIWHQERRRPTMSSRTDWRYSLAWARTGLRRGRVTPRAYASFLMTWLSANAVRQGDRAAFLPLLREAFRRGRPSLLDALLCAGVWVTPPGAREGAVAFVSRRLAFRRGWRGTAA